MPKPTPSRSVASALQCCAPPHLGGGSQPISRDLFLPASMGSMSCRAAMPAAGGLNVLAGSRRVHSEWPCTHRRHNDGRRARPASGPLPLHAPALSDAPSPNSMPPNSAAHRSVAHPSFTAGGSSGTPAPTRGGPNPPPVPASYNLPPNVPGAASCTVSTHAYSSLLARLQV